MSFITIVDLEVFYRVGVSDEERARPQRLLLTIDIKFDFSSAAVSGRVGRTIDYHEVTKHLIKLGENRNWKLIESVATDIAAKILSEFRQNFGGDVRGHGFDQFPVPVFAQFDQVFGDLMIINCPPDAAAHRRR